jgi:hypothetical protein
LPLIRVGGEILLEPLPLGGAGTAADLCLPAVAVEGDYVPASKIVGVVALIGISGRLTEVVEVASCPLGFVLVVALASLAALCNKVRLTSPVITKGLGGVWGRPL